MNKKLIFILIIVSLLLIAGCTGGSKEERPITDFDIRKGVEGLKMEFTTNAPPETVFEGDEAGGGVFPIAVILRNKGASDIEATEIKDGGTVKGVLVFGFETANVDVPFRNVLEKFRKMKAEIPPNELNELKDDMKMLLTEYLTVLLIKEPEMLSSAGLTAIEVFSETYLTSLFDKELGILGDGELRGLDITGLVTSNDIKDVLKDDIKDFIPEQKIELVVEGLKVYRSELIRLVKDDIISKEIKIDGKSIFNPNGDEEIITLNVQAKQIGAQSEKQPSTILATACYPYKTILGTSICIDTDIYGIRREEKACSITDLNFAGGQGAPVVITKIETRMLPDVDQNKIKPHFLIFIENKGNGEVVNLGNVEQACTSETLDYTAFNRILIKASLSDKPLDCRIDKDVPGPPEPALIRLRDKENMVRCTLQEGIDISRDAYTSPLKIELEYGYTFTISKNIIIEKILTY